MVPGLINFAGNGIAFVISPSIDFSGADSGSYLGLFNISNNGLSTNHILAVELDTVQSHGFQDINGNHVGIDVNNLISNNSAPAAYFSDEERKNKSLAIESGNPTQMWIDCNGAEKLLNVTLAPIGIPKPSRPLLSTSIDLSRILLDTMYVGFSAATGTHVSDHYILGWSFNKTGQAQNLNIKNLPSLPKRGENTKPSLPFIVLIVAAVVVLTTIVAAVYFVRKKKYEEIYEDWEREYGPQRFSYKNLYKATRGFNDTEIIGKGGFGKVYKDTDLNGKLGDFGLARLHDHGSNPQTTKLVGTIGYMAPEIPITGKVSTSTDVYAFRVFMLEVACGKRPMEQRGFVLDCWRR
ncbi:hypothetical protein Dsin_020329 [Dipteronia sinensis]|uniref:Protein kinase domain-containing protein n=1 Tax=Dipteronia sinensis TaxID=43782 RepID=A0AAE0AA87_9ROSI|nr:hypothetical protein Dsin_020329 [Dipteronia sinensis]